MEIKRQNMVKEVKLQELKHRLEEEKRERLESEVKYEEMLIIEYESIVSNRDEEEDTENNKVKRETPIPALASETESEDSNSDTSDGIIESEVLRFLQNLPPTDMKKTKNIMYHLKSVKRVVHNTDRQY